MADLLRSLAYFVAWMMGVGRSPPPRPDLRDSRWGLYDRRPGQPFGNQYFLIRSPSVLNSTLVPRCSRICLVVRLIIPWRLPDWAKSTFPEAVTLKRFFAPDFVFSLGIWLSFPTWTPPPSPAKRVSVGWVHRCCSMKLEAREREARRSLRLDLSRLLVMSVLLEHSAATAALQPGGGRPGYGRAARKWQPPGQQKATTGPARKSAPVAMPGALGAGSGRGDYFGANTMTI